MTELANSLPESDQASIAHATDLLTHYSFDLGRQTASQLTNHWLQEFSASWIRWAVIEALYQGRYKAISVSQILLLWKRRNQPRYHFNYEFERLVCNKFPKNLNPKPSGLLEFKPTIVPHSEPSLADPSPELEPIAEPVPAWFALAGQVQDEADLPVSSGVKSLGAIAPLDLVESLSSALVKIQAIEELTEPSPVASDLAIESVAPDLLTENSENGHADDNPPPIHQFMPISSAPDFHTKLRAVAEQNSEEVSRG